MWISQKKAKTAKPLATPDTDGQNLIFIASFASFCEKHFNQKTENDLRGIALVNLDIAHCRTDS